LSKIWRKAGDSRANVLKGLAGGPVITTTQAFRVQTTNGFTGKLQTLRKTPRVSD
jgi:hypothetical protein